MPFETPLPPGFFDVSMSAITAAEIHEPGVLPSTVLRKDQPWSINVEWDTAGLLTGWIAGNWHLHVYLESMGPGDEVEITDPNEHLIPLVPGPSPCHYHFHPDVPLNAIKEDGAYKLVVTVTYINAAGHPAPMAGYWEGPIIQFYTP